MESLTRNVGDIDANDRQALEHVLGRSLREDQLLVIQIVNLNVQSEPAQSVTSQQTSQQKSVTPSLPEWCHAYEGLSDEEITDLETTILQRADFNRSTE